MAKEEEMQQKYTQFQMLQQQIEQISNHTEKLNQQGAEIETSIEALAEFTKTPLDTELFSPIANGIFIKAEIKDNQKLLVNVGADTVVEKSVPDTIELLQGHQKELSTKIIEAEALLQQFHQQAMQIYQEIEKES